MMQPQVQAMYGTEYTLFLLEDRESKPVAVLLPTDAVAAQELVLPQVRHSASLGPAPGLGPGGFCHVMVP